MGSRSNSRQWLERADEALASAALLLDYGDVNRSCSSAYYAMFYAARAALIHVGQPERALGKTHSGLVAAFGQFIVQPGLVGKSLGQAFSHELNRRIAADYEADGVSQAAAREALANAEEFVRVVAEMLGESAAS